MLTVANRLLQNLSQTNGSKELMVIFSSVRSAGAFPSLSDNHLVEHTYMPLT